PGAGDRRPRARRVGRGRRPAGRLPRLRRHPGRGATAAAGGAARRAGPGYVCILCYFLRLSDRLGVVLTVVVDYYVSKIPGRRVMIAGTVAEGTEPVTGTTIAIRAEGHALVTALV